MQDFLKDIQKIGCYDIDFKYKPGDVPFPMQRVKWKLETHTFLEFPMRYISENGSSVSESVAAVHVNLVEMMHVREDFAKIVSRENVHDAFFMGRWLKYKQIYKFDKTCSEMLKETCVDKIPPAVFDGLPYDSFYIESDFSQGCVGCFVSITPDENNNYNNKYLGMEFVKNDANAEFYTAFIPMFGDLVDTNEGFPSDKENNHKLCKEALPLILYLCSENKDVQYIEPKTKKEIQRAKKSGGVKTSKVGYKIGATISSTKRVYISSSSHNGKHTPKSPHMRAAHYQHYWSGPRDSKERKCVLKFVEPMFIKGGKADLPTVHKVKK